MTLFEHLAELRRRVIICVIAFAVTATGAFIVYVHILHFLQAPLCKVETPCTFLVTGPLDGLTFRMKVATYGGAFLALPIVLWQMWRFVTPGLKQNEKKYASAFVGSAVLLFATGAALAYWSFPHALALMAVFGVTFEFPVVLVALELAGVVEPAWLAHHRRWAFFLIVVTAAIITPSGDPFSMLALAVPLYVFYEVSIVFGRLLRRRSAADQVDP